jgi:hypothetical protein
MNLRRRMSPTSEAQRPQDDPKLREGFRKPREHFDLQVIHEVRHAIASPDETAAASWHPSRKGGLGYHGWHQPSITWSRPARRGF